ncbi:MAG: hypothetical protein EPN84_05285 [Legionella sp.]|nr:MAG: hypothetical protein EPN84_05285 [Legionella sp.]
MNSDCQILVSSQMKNLDSLTSQILVVKSFDNFRARITACQLQGTVWKPVLSPKSFPGVIGKSGVAQLGEKKEGDLKTPAGLYPLGEAFGSEPLAIKMDYRYITSDDKFIDDVTSPQYNTWVNGRTDAKSFESMLIDQYKMGVVINYNMNPIIAGSGSAIFIHLWSSSDTATTGCIALDKRHLSALLQWLDKNQHPHIFITG